MEEETLATAKVLINQFSENYALLEQIALQIRSIQPALVVTIGRGSSNYAALFAKYLFESRVNLITAAAAPSILTLYNKKLPQKNSLVLGISQSGQSPDVIESMKVARKGGALTIAIVNDVNSPLAEEAQYVIPQRAGEEKSIAATKTFIATLAVLIQLVAILTEDSVLLKALSQVPEKLIQAANMDWSIAMDIYAPVQHTYVIGRGYGYPLALEAALKFKETVKIHAEGLSSADLEHGPFELISKGFPIFIFAQQDETFASLYELGVRLKALGIKVLVASPFTNEHFVKLAQMSSFVLPLPKGVHPICDPLMIIYNVYLMLAKLCAVKNINPDLPTYLNKVTKTW